MKKIFYASFIAVLTGVVLLGVNAAFGANTPSVAPENADLVSPVFGGLDVRGFIKNTSENNNGAIAISDDLAVEKDVTTNNLFVGNNAQIGEILSVAGVVISKNATGDIISSSSDPADPVSFGSKVLVNNSLTAGKSFFAEGDVTMNKNLDILGKITNIALQLVEVDSNLKVTGNADFNGEISNSAIEQSVVPVPKPVIVNDDFQVFEKTYLVKDVQASAKLNVIGKTNTAGGLLVNNGLTVSGNAAFADNVEVTGSISNPNFLPVDIQSDVDINGSMSTTGNVYVNGTIVAEQFGSYNKKSSGWFKFDVNTGTKTIACNAGDVVISCGVDVWNNIQDTEINEVDFDTDTNSCTANASNKSASTDRWFRTTALCFNSGL